MSSFQGITLKTMKLMVVSDMDDNQIIGNVKIIKLKSEVQPFILVKNTIIDGTTFTAMPWNTRKLVTFDFETYPGLINGNIGKIMTQYSPISSDSIGTGYTGYTVFNVLKIKIKGESVFKRIQRTIDLFQTDSTQANFGQKIGTQLENINISPNSFKTDGNTQLPNSITDHDVLDAGFDFKCKITTAELYSVNENVSEEEDFQDMIYIFNNNFTTGFSENAIETEMKLKFLMDNTETVEIINTSPNINYDILINNSTSGNIISSNNNNIITLFVKINSGVTNSKSPLRFISNDIIFNSFVPEFKTIGSTTYLVSSKPSGINPELYVFNVSVFKISAVDRITRSTTSVISLNGSREIEIFIEPDLTVEYFGGATPLSQALPIGIVNNNPNIFQIQEVGTEANISTILFPTIAGNSISNAIFIIKSLENPDNLNEELVISFNFQPIAGSIFAGLQIPDISIQIASIFSNTTKVFLNTASSSIVYNPPLIIGTAPGTIQDLSSAELVGVDSQLSVVAQTYNFNVRVIDNEFTVEYVSGLQTASIVRRFGNLASDINFSAYENDIYVFDTSHPSNKNHMLSFFTSSTITGSNYLSDDFIAINNEINQGEPGAVISLTVPSFANYTDIYISDFPTGTEQQNKLNGLCRIGILANPTNIDIGTFNFNTLIGSGTSSMTFVPNLDGNNRPIEGINVLDISNNPNNTDATRILDLFSGEKNPIPQITVYSIYLSKPTNVTFTVFNTEFVSLNWKIHNGNIYTAANPLLSRFAIDIYYNIYRDDKEANKTELIGTSILNTFTDSSAKNFKNYGYYIESVATWNGLSLTSERSSELFVFVCENNRFPQGRWNNSFTNTKIYKQITECSEEMTTSLFPNSWSISQNEIYARLSKLPISKR